MFRLLLAYPQEALYKRHLVHYVRIMSVDCGTVAVKLQPCNWNFSGVLMSAHKYLSAFYVGGNLWLICLHSF
jgi:hypothetical protein